MNTASNHDLFGLGFLGSYECSLGGPSARRLLGLRFPMGKWLTGEYRGGLGWLTWWALEWSFISYFLFNNQL